jgi:hypothetical protein
MARRISSALLGVVIALAGCGGGDGQSTTDAGTGATSGSGGGSGNGGSGASSGNGGSGGNGGASGSGTGASGGAGAAGGTGGSGGSGATGGGGSCLVDGFLSSINKNHLLVGASMDDNIASANPFDLRYLAGHLVCEHGGMRLVGLLAVRSSPAGSVCAGLRRQGKR